MPMPLNREYGPILEMCMFLCSDLFKCLTIVMFKFQSIIKDYIFHVFNKNKVINHFTLRRI